MSVSDVQALGGKTQLVGVSVKEIEKFPDDDVLELSTRKVMLSKWSYTRRMGRVRWRV